MKRTLAALAAAVLVSPWSGPVFRVLAAAAEPAPPAGDWQVVRVVADEYRFTPSHVTAVAGLPLRIEIENRGSEQHEFRSRLLREHLADVELAGGTVRGRGVESVVVEERRTAVIKILAPAAGQYDFECRIPSHHGMDGVIVIR